MDLVNQLQQLNNALNSGIKLMAKYGKEKAEAEMNYKITLNQNVIKLKDAGEKATTIPLLVYGIKEVAEKRFKRDVAETMYETAQENVNSIKLQMRMLDAQLTREWGLTKNN